MSAGNLIGRNVSLTLVAALALWSATRIHAQPCEMQWTEALFASQGTDGVVMASAAFDDGAGEALYIGGGFGSAGGASASYIAKWDGTKWSTIGELDNWVYALAAFDDGTGPALYAGGEFLFDYSGWWNLRRIAKWDGQEWLPLGDGMNAAVTTLAAYDDGSGPALYAGGFFTDAAGVSAHRIAKWDGTQWSALGSGLNGPVYAMTIFAGSLYVGGDFTTAGGQSAKYIARWDGVSWWPVAGGFNASVDALTVFDDGTGPALYAGGYFTQAAGSPTNHVAKLSAGTWVPLGDGTDGPVFDLIVHDAGAGSALYVGGDFTQAGGLSAPYLALWTGQAWSPMHHPPDDAVETFAVFDDGHGPALYAAGWFITAGALVVNHVARWDSSGVLALGGQGLNGEVYALAVFDDGTGPALYAGGDFTIAGGLPVEHIARWDGTQWSPLGSGVSGGSYEGPTVYALTVFDDGAGPALFVGGDFVQADGIAVNRIAKWDGNSWSPLLGGIWDWGTVNALTVFDDGSGPALYIGGRFDAVGGLIADAIAGGGWHSLGLKADGSIVAWGASWDGQCDVPAPNSGFVGVAAGHDHSLGLKADGSIVAWGWNDYGQCDVPAPNSGFVAVAAGNYHSLGLKADGPVVAWGGNGDGQCDVPAPNSGFVAVAGGGYHSLGLKADGSSVAWGDNGDGQCDPVQYASNVVRWDGTDWSPLGSGVNDAVNALSVFDDGTGPALYAGGWFATAGGVPAGNIAKWDGTQWSPLGDGVDGTVSTLAVFDDGTGPALYAGGSFSTAAGLPARNIAEWNGLFWSPVLSGLSSTVWSLTVFDDGTGPALYAGGEFESTGDWSVELNGIGKWDGLTWSALGGGLGYGGWRGFAYALAAFDDGHGPALHVGGFFTAAGGYPSTYIARWGCQAPPVCVGDLNCDGTYGQGSFGDINPFVLYLSNFAAWQAEFPGCNPLNGDINGDGLYPDFGDINPFVALLTGG